MSTGNMTRLTDNINEAKTYAREALGALPDIIHCGESTLPTDNNLFSARRIIQDFLSKDTDAKVRGLLQFLKGIGIGEQYGINAKGEATLSSLLLNALQSYNFNEAEQRGFAIHRRADGKYRLALTDLQVWGKATFNELEKLKISYVGGNMVFSACGSRIKRVVDNGTTWRCYFHQDDGTTATTNLWEVDDQARCQTFNIKTGVYAGVANRSYWRRVMDVGEDYIDLSKADCEQGSDAPTVDDTLVQFGNRTKPERQNIIIIYTTGNNAPSYVMYAGVNSYTLEGKATTTLSPNDVAILAKNFRLISSNGALIPMVVNRGTWAAGEKYSYYDQVSHDGRLWLCVAPQGKIVTSWPVANNPDWQLQVDKGTNGVNGISPITMTIESDKGSILYNGQGAIKLTAHVYEGNREITSTIVASKFSWLRVSTGADTIFNNAHQGVGNTISVTRDDVMKMNAKFECILND